jgi:integrase
MSVRRRGDSWQVDIVDPAGTRHRKSFKVKADAFAFELEAKAGKVESSLKAPTCRVTFKDVQLMAEKEWKTTKDAVNSIRRGQESVDFFGEATLVSEVTYARVEAFIAKMQSQKLAGGTINRKLAALSVLFKMARRIDPAVIKPELPKQKEGKPRERVLTAEEQDKMLTWDGWTEVYRALTTFLIQTGARLAEAINTKKVKVVGNDCTFFDTKNGEDRTITLTPRALEAWKVYSKRLKADDQWKYRRAFEAMRVATKLGDDVVIHTLRHSCLTTLGNRTKNALLIQKWAGHKSIATTQRYVKANKEGMDALAQMLE